MDRVLNFVAGRGDGRSMKILANRQCQSNRFTVVDG